MIMKDNEAVAPAIDVSDSATSYVSAFLTMVFLFFVVGFLTTVNTQFQAPLKEAFLGGMGAMQNTFATLITFSWFLAYPVCGPIGSRWISRSGYRATLIKGLTMMIGGLMLFILSVAGAVSFPETVIAAGGFTLPVSFLIFLLGSFLTGGSVTVLQVVINPYLTACSVRGTQAVQRMAIGGSANSIGTAIAPYFVTGIVFGGVALDDISIDSLFVPFMILAAAILALALGLRSIRLPELSDTHTEGVSKLPRSVWSFRHLTLGVVAIFFYVGAEVCLGANITMYAFELSLDSVALITTVYWVGILLGRLVGSGLRTVSPRVQLTFTTSCAVILIIVAIAVESPWVLASVGLCHSIMWGCIFTLAVKGLGKYTTAATGAFMAGVVGGAIMPLVQGVWADIIGGWHYTWWLVCAAELFMLYYALIGSKIKENEIVE